MNAERPKTTNIEAGCFYSPRYVGALFGFGAEWARQACKRGQFPGARKLPGSTVWVIPGADVLILIGQQQLDRDRLATAATMPTAAEERRQAEEALKELDQLNAAKKRKR